MPSALPTDRPAVGNDRVMTPDGLELRVRLDLPPGEVRARVILIHGIGDQVDGVPYTLAAAALAARGFAVHRVELRGHGRSGGVRTYVREWQEYRRDVRSVVDMLRASHPAAPLFLVGVSMGGLIVTDNALYHPQGIAGVVAVAPALGDTGGSPLMRALLPLLVRVAPRVHVNPKLDLTRLTRDPEMFRRYITEDPLYQATITPSLAVALLGAIARVRADAARLVVPLLVLHGTADTVTSPRGSREFFERAGSADKTYQAYEGGFHNLFVDTNRDEVFADVVSWMTARC